MATSYLNYCDNCRRVNDILYIDELTGLELCLECFNDENSDEDSDFEYDYDDDD